MAWGLGIPSVDTLLESLTAPELDEWQTWFNLVPHESDKADVRHGILAYLIARTMGGVKNKEVKDFIPEWTAERKEEKPAKRQTAAEMASFLMKVTVMNKGTIH